MSDVKVSKIGGINFFGMLQILFIGLKLGNVITWPWVWVLTPLWMPLAISLGVVGIALGVAGISFIGFIILVIGKAIFKRNK